MSTDIIGARDTMFAIVTNAWRAATIQVLGSDKTANMRFQGIAAIEPSADQFWCRVSMNNVLESQANLGQVDGKRRRTARGNVFVQMFFPLSQADAWGQGLLLAKAVKNALAGPSSSGTVWLRNARINDGIGPEENHHRLNVVADYEYDELV